MVFRTSLFILVSIIGSTVFAAPVYLNHFVNMVDQKTYDDIKNSAFLTNEFGYINCGTSGWSPDPNHPGSVCYIMAENTYIEIFDPNGDKGSPGDIKFGMGTDSVGDLIPVNAALQKEFTTAELPYVNELLKNKDVPWFWLSEFDIPNDPKNMTYIGAWIMEYHPDYMKSQAVSRKAYNSKRYNPNQLLRDIVGLSLSVSSTQFDFLKRMYQVYNFKMHEDAGFTVFFGPEIEIRLEKGDETVLRSIEFATNSVKTGKLTFPFGNSSYLEFKNNEKRATWYFNSEKR